MRDEPLGVFRQGFAANSDDKCLNVGDNLFFNHFLPLLAGLFGPVGIVIKPQAGSLEKRGHGRVVADVFCEKVNFHPCATENATGKGQIFENAAQLVGRRQLRYDSME